MPTREQVHEYIDQDLGNCVPVWVTLPADVLTPVMAYLRITDGCKTVSDDNHAGSFLLESVVGGSHVGRYSFVGANPYRVLRSGKGKEVEGDPLIALQTELDRYRYVEVPGAPLFTGGAIGYVGYDCIRHFEKKAERPLTDPIGIPESVFMLCDSVIVFDHLFQTVKAVSHVILPSAQSDQHATSRPSKTQIDELYDEANRRIAKVVDLLQSTQPIPFPEQPPIEYPGQEPVSNVGEAGYKAFVTQLRKHIVKGDIIQAVPSQRFAKPTALHPFNAYRYLRQVNPSPYMFYVDCGQGLSLVGASPECLCKVEKNKVTNHAIAGTIKRGSSEIEDERLAEELRGSEKDRAEHVMLVDLARNDVNRVCQPTTVTVDSLMQVEKFSHVMHLTSQVSGILRSDKTRFDAFRSIFPAGTVSGAPKIRAMQLIAELEKEARGVYAGAVGRFNFAHDTMDTCIAIRTMTFKDGVAYLQAGGGIVFDSNEEDEYIETLNKLKSNLSCLDQAERYYAQS
ncbi:uncharacterized protein L969DRAFT_93209 [Mixia osmundae IAM 14324]|uniref:anthranilate synthase n=1 Tax=Mixia osmundae (strain CBS 9802 / IAM 14324 / JCM 22182 / KY 12970) TaxID=764103 RepID=G7E5S3_MIXOS|nr:uncharacterized protein L969DRAFT_93209 [Mixia osmundae IAM 14324]KEI40667.1 hypothetical protein L969DRAFT_93209 [Mixia osmundae IAM 14324]GAA98183.1 hypothetical protein E5Q_04866 [Mixia osmundae IAM 14324]